MFFCVWNAYWQESNGCIFNINIQFVDYPERKKMANLREILLEARLCQRCYPETKICVPLPDPNNSIGEVDIIFINERPGRIGTGQSGYISFDNDDPAANFFRECFDLVGLDRQKVFITNACLCYPLSDGYTDTKPTVSELTNCHFWLRKQLEVANPKLIVTIGESAWKSALRYFDCWHQFKHIGFLKSVGNVITETTPWIFPLSHTSRRGRVHRSAGLQRNDWKKIPGIIRQLENVPQ